MYPLALALSTFTNSHIDKPTIKQLTAYYNAVNTDKVNEAWIITQLYKYNRTHDIKINNI